MRQPNITSNPQLIKRLQHSRPGSHELLTPDATLEGSLIAVPDPLELALAEVLIKDPKFGVKSSESALRHQAPSDEQIVAGDDKRETVVDSNEAGGLLGELASVRPASDLPLGDHNREMIAGILLSNEVGPASKQRQNTNSPNLDVMSNFRPGAQSSEPDIGTSAPKLPPREEEPFGKYDVGPDGTYVTSAPPKGTTKVFETDIGPARAGTPAETKEFGTVNGFHIVFEQSAGGQVFAGGGDVMVLINVYNGPDPKTRRLIRKEVVPVVTIHGKKVIKRFSYTGWIEVRILPTETTGQGTYVSVYK